MTMSDPMKTQMLVDPNKTVISSAPSINATQTIQPVQCPICKTFNPAGMIYCVECGLIFATELPEDAFGAPAVRPPCLVDEGRKEQFLRPGSNIVGREGDILLQDGRVSRRHAEITLDPSGITLTDLGSTNGTKLNGQPLAPNSPQKVNPNDALEFGGYRMTLSMPGESQATQIPGSNKTQTMTAPPGAEPHAALLHFEDQTVPLKTGVNTIGRKPGNDVVLSDGYVSGSHGTIEVTDEAFYFTDLGSTNGSTLNGAKVPANERVSLNPDDELEIGRTKVRISRAESMQ